MTDDKGASDDAETVITVTPVDTTPPAVKSVEAKGETNLYVRFGEPVEQAGAAIAENYQISQGVKVLAVVLDPDAAGVMLATTPLAEDVKFEFTVRNIKDRARTPNSIAAGAGQAFYRFRSPPDEEGYIRTWLRLPCMPVESTAGKDVFSKEYFPGQNTGAPNEGDKISAGGKELAWKVARSADDAVLSLTDGYGMFFCVTYLTCQEDIPNVRLRMGGNHDSSLWHLNGQEIIRTYANRGLTRDQCQSDPITLKKGLNVLTAQVVMTTYGGRGICARFVDKDVNPVGAYSISTGAPLAAPAGPVIGGTAAK